MGGAREVGDGEGGGGLLSGVGGHRGAVGGAGGKRLGGSWRAAADSCGGVCEGDCWALQGGLRP